VNAIVLCSFCIGNIAGPFMWKQKYKPRDHVPWEVIAACVVVCPTILLTIRFLLAKENKLRDSEPYDDTWDDVVVRTTDGDGKVTEHKVDKEFLDLTDKQNREFRYVL
jgi:hypothetical protein